MKTLSLEEYLNLLEAQGVPRLDLAVVCPLCKTVQSGRDLIRAGAGKNFEEIEPYLGFSCVGRWTGAGAPRKEPDGKPCNWTLGGLINLHDLEVITPDGEHHMRFEPATPKQAQQHAQRNR